MFTGIVEEIGIVKSLKKSASGMEIEISCKKVLLSSNIGDSISINGVCITASKISANSFSGDVMNETIDTTCLKQLKINEKVNLETALTLIKPMGGHFVLGHVDSTGIVDKVYMDGFSKVVNILYPYKFRQNLIDKGSLAINGVSLTIHKLTDSYIQIKLIPHSTSETNLSDIKEGNFVNIEFDFLGKYALNILKGEKKVSINDKISEGFLMENGFL